jgi:hypothetical protein
MEKYKVDFSEAAHFKGITISFDYLEEGLNYAQQSGIKEVCISTDDIDTKVIVNFSFLEGKEFITTFHWLVPISKKSNIEGLYYLSKLENLRWWSGDTDLKIDLSRIHNLRILNIGYSKEIKGWEDLKLLSRLLIGGVKSEDLSFLSQMNNLEYLRIIRGTFVSINGLEKCNKLKTIFIQTCNSLIHVKETLSQMKGIENLALEKCKSVDLKGVESLGLKNLSVI